MYFHIGYGDGKRRYGGGGRNSLSAFISLARIIRWVGEGYFGK